VYVDPNANGTVKRYSDDSFVLWPCSVNTNVDGVAYNYMYLLQSLDMQGHKIYGINPKNNSNDSIDPSGLWIVNNNVTNNGSFDYTHQGTYGVGGSLRINAGGSIAVNNVFTYGNARAGGNVYLFASNGSVHVVGQISTYTATGNTPSGNVTIRSEGNIAGQGIRIDGRDGYNSSINVTLTGNWTAPTPIGIGLYTQGDIQLAGGIYGLQGCVVTLGGSYTNTTIRAGQVTVGGDIATWGTSQYNGGSYVFGVVTVVAKSLVVHGAIDTHSGGTTHPTHGAGVSIDVLANAQVDGYIDTHTAGNSPGPVYIKAQHIAICGTNSVGASIYTKPDNSSGLSLPQTGDGNVTLTNVDTSTAWYNPKTPFTGDTSSILVSGKVVTAYCGVPQILGDVYMSAVGVYLYGAISNANVNAAVTNQFHVGVINHGVVTHLVENGVQWTGGATAHNINYPVSPATNLFFTDVPYAGNLGKVGTAVFFR
jgi:hypothetical protein